MLLSDAMNENETITTNVLKKLANFFSERSSLTYNHLNDFLEELNLTDVFGSDGDKAIIWNIFTRISGNQNEIDQESCKQGILEIFEFYGVTNKNEEGDMQDLQDKLVGVRESVQMKEKKLDDLLTRITTGKPKEEKKKKPRHERKITKVFSEINIDKLQQLRKIFSLLDLRNKEYVYIADIQDVIKKFKFIKITQDELITFLSFISDDLKATLDILNNGKLSINYDLYSRAMSAIEQQILQNNLSDTYVEKNDSYEVNDNWNDLLEELGAIETEGSDYILVLSELVKCMEARVNESIVENYERIVNRDLGVGESEGSIREQVTEGITNFRNKVKDFNIFLKELGKTINKGGYRIESLKQVITRMEVNFKTLEDDYRALFERLNSTQPTEVNDETEQLMDENMYLNEQVVHKNNEIEDLNKQIDVRDEQLFNLQVRLDKCAIKEKENLTEYNKIKYAHDELKKTYDQLLNDIYEKIQNEEKHSLKTDKSKRETGNMGENDTIRKLREKLVKHEDSKKIFDMNYEQLIIYTCNLEIANKQHEDDRASYERRIKELEKELQDMMNKYNESQKQIHLLKSENSRLQNKVNEVNRDNEMNMIYRPSRALNTRMSRVSKFETKGSGNTGLAFRPQIAAKIFETEGGGTKTDTGMSFKESDKELKPIVIDTNQPEIRLSTLEEVDTLNVSRANKLNNYDSSFVFKNNDQFNLTASRFNFTREMQEHSITNTTNVFGPKDDLSTSSVNDKYLFGAGDDDNTLNQTESFSIKQSITGKNVIMDYMDDNPFEKNIDEDDNDVTEDNEESNTNTKGTAEPVDFKAFSKNSNLDVNIEEYQQRREKQRQKELNKAKKVVTTANNRNPSMINEEEDEEEAEKEKVSLKKDEKGGVVKGHNRYQTIEDLGLVMTKDSEYMCYDFLTLRKNMAVIKILEEKWEDVSSYEMFSDNIYLIDDTNKKSKKYLFITSKRFNKPR
jgi:hypothetical protein